MTVLLPHNRKPFSESFYVELSNVIELTVDQLTTQAIQITCCQYPDIGDDRRSTRHDTLRGYLSAG